MVRLTDLVGSHDRKKHQSAPSSTSPPPQRRPSGKSGTEFLPASDLENLYDVTGQDTQNAVTADPATPFTPPPASAPVQMQPPAQEAIPYQSPAPPPPAAPQQPTAPPPQAVPQQPTAPPPQAAPQQAAAPPQQVAPQPPATPDQEQLSPQVQEQASPPVPKQMSPPRRAAVISDYSAEEDKKNTDIADSIHIEILDLLDDLYSEGREKKIVNLGPLIEPLMRLIVICRSANAILRKAIRMKKGGETQTSHSLNTCILAIKIGVEREYTDEKLFSLGMCAMFGDIGMGRVDPAILNKKGKLEPGEFQEIKNHVKHSQDIALQIANKFPFLAPIVYQIHERENGNGYPEGLRGGNIHEFAKIIGMCDVYIAMTSPKRHRTDFSGYETLEQIISRRGIDFNAGVIKSLIEVISVFPIESLVKLNNGAIGRVIDISSVHPTRPKLLILVDNDGERLKVGKVLDLEKEPLLYIEDPDIEEGAIL